MRLVNYYNGQAADAVELPADRVQLQEAVRARPGGRLRIEATAQEARAIHARPIGSFGDLAVELFLDSARPDGRLIWVQVRP